MLVSTHRIAALVATSCAVLALAGLTAPAARAQTTYNFLFDGTFDNTTTPPFFGTGVFNFTNDLGLGTFSYNALGPVSFTFVLDGETYTEADIVSDPNKTTVVFTAVNGGRRLQFSDTGNGAGGPSDGSLDLLNSNGEDLTFEPSYFGGGLNLYDSSTGFGSYIALSPGANVVPEPGAVATGSLLGATMLIGMVRGRRRKATSKAA